MSWGGEESTMKESVVGACFKDVWNSFYVFADTSTANKGEGEGSGQYLPHPQLNATQKVSL